MANLNKSQFGWHAQSAALGVVVSPATPFVPQGVPLDGGTAGRAGRGARALIVVLLLGTALLALRSAVAEDRPLDFIHALQKKDLADAAVDYLKMLKAKSPMPAEVAEVWDLEMSQSLHAAASQNAFDSKDFDEQMTAAQKYLDKFIQEKPNHPEAVTAMVAWGDFLMERAAQHLATARALTDKAQWALQMQEARAALEAAAPKYKLAIDKYKERLAALPPPGLPASKRES